MAWFYLQYAFRALQLLSQCSTVVRNTVVRATIKVDGEPQILGTCSPKHLNQST